MMVFLLQPPVPEVLEEPPHVILIVGTDQGKGHGQVADRVGGQQQREAAQVQFIHAESPAEVLQDHAAMVGQIELLDSVAQHVVDEPRGEVQEELAAQRLQGLFDVHAVLEDPPQDQIADLVVVEGPGEHALGGIAEGRAAVTPGLILATGDLQRDDGLVGDGPDLARGQGAFAAARLATPGAGGLLGGAVNR
jgi:hypothetical protein